MLFVGTGSGSWTELENVQLTSSAVQSSSGLLSGCSLFYTAPTNFSHDVTPVTSLPGVPQLTSSFGVLYIDDSSAVPATNGSVPCATELNNVVTGISQLASSFGVPYTYVSSAIPAANGSVPCTTQFNNDVASLPGVPPMTSMTGILHSVHEDPVLSDPWNPLFLQTTMMPGHAVSCATPASTTLQLMSGTDAQCLPLLTVSSPSSAGPLSDDMDAGDDNVFLSSYATHVSYAPLPTFPPTPPDSVSSSPSPPEFPVTAVSLLPPPYPAASSSAGTSPTTFGVRSVTESSAFEVPLTRVTRRPRRTHPGCSTIKYQGRRNQKPDIEQRRVHRCHFPSMCYSSIMCMYLYTIMTRDRKVTGSTTGRGAIQSTRSTQPSIPPG